MADTKTEAQPMRDADNFVMKSSVNVKSMGNPQKTVAMMKENVEVELFGTIVGLASGVNRRADPKGGPDYMGLTGAFCAIPADPQRAEVRAMICYLPDAIHSPIAATLAAAHEKNETLQVRFAMEAYVRKGGTAGFTWEFKPVFDTSSKGVMVDPLASMRSAVTGGNVKALPDMTTSEKTQAATLASQQQGSRFDKQAEPAKGAARK